LLFYDATAKTTLKYLAIKHLEIGTSHPLWKMRSKTGIGVKKSIIKARINSPAWRIVDSIFSDEVLPL
jgi:hypothetical protein